MEENEEREAQGEGYEAHPEILISELTIDPPSTRPQTPPEPSEESNTALGQTDILRALEVVERDSVAIAESFTSLFSSLRLAISEVTGSSVNHMHCFTDAAGCLQESDMKQIKETYTLNNAFCYAVLDAATKGNRYINSCLRLNEEMKGMDSLAIQLKFLRRNVDALDTAVNKLLRLP